MTIRIESMNALYTTFIVTNMEGDEIFYRGTLEGARAFIAAATKS